VKSPIERQLRDALRLCVPPETVYLDRTSHAPSAIKCYCSLTHGLQVDIDFSEGADWYEHQVRVCTAPSGVGLHVFNLYRDVRLKTYRADFLFLTDDCLPFVIECDGHEWHERTKQQAAYDRARDRELAILGIPTLRFTGSEIVHSAERCAREIFDFALHLSAASRGHVEAELRSAWLESVNCNRAPQGTFGLLGGLL
jgi:very-short-patch-repair endonuclease